MSKRTARLFGWMFLILGIFGFFWNPIFGVFKTGILLSAVYLATGLCGVIASASKEHATKSYLKTFGVVYGITTVWGLFTSNLLFGLLPVNGSGTLLHLIVALIFLYSGYSSPSSHARPKD